VELDEAAGAAGEIAQNILDTLITIDSDQKLYPALASKWTITDSSKTFTFTTSPTPRSSAAGLRPTGDGTRPPRDLRVREPAWR